MKNLAPKFTNSQPKALADAMLCAVDWFCVPWFSVPWIGLGLRAQRAY